MPFIKFMLMAVITFFALTQNVFAQSYQMTSSPVREMEKKPTISLPVLDEEKEMTVMRDDFFGKYDPSNIENLSKLYWRLGVFDIEDEKAIMHYIKINDCKIFNNYFNDDFEWQKIIGNVKNHLQNNSQNFPLKYQFVLNLALGKYNVEKGGFDIIEKTGFSNSMLINVATLDYGQEICDDSSVDQIYPKSVIILLSKPLDFTFVKVDEHVAQAFILKKKNYAKRDAYLRLRVKFNEYVGNLKGENNTTFSVITGDVDGYEVFEDGRLENLMLSVSLNESNNDNNNQTKALKSSNSSVQ